VLKIVNKSKQKTALPRLLKSGGLFIIKTGKQANKIQGG